MRRLTRRLLPVLLLAGLAPLAFGACMGYPAQVTPGQETAPTMAPPESSGESRLPGLVSQLQSGWPGLELFDGSQSEVLAAQDAQDKGDGSETPAVTGTPSGTPQPTPTRTPSGSLPLTQPTPTPTPTATPTPSPSPAATTEAQPTVAPSPTVAPTSTPVPTIDPGGTPPTEGEGAPTQAPPTEG